VSRFREDVIAGDLIFFGDHAQIVVMPGSVAGDSVLAKDGCTELTKRFAGALIVNRWRRGVVFGTAYAFSRTVWSCASV